jgi:hypothetical protein
VSVLPSCGVPATTGGDVFTGVAAKAGVAKRNEKTIVAANIAR